jgi:2-phosphoglycerate kinase
MSTLNKSTNQHLDIPNGFIVFISGVPGVGKTTVSYALLRLFDRFRIIEETDIMRETLRGYNEYIEEEFKDKANFLFERINITDHTILLTFEEAKQQCLFMKKSFDKIIRRQERRGIPSIINGVHIVPEVLYGLAENRNIIFINLYIYSEQVLRNRLIDRDPLSYMANHVPLIYKTNEDLFISTQRASKKNKYSFHNIDVTNLSIKETVESVADCIKTKLNFEFIS